MQLHYWGNPKTITKVMSIVKHQPVPNAEVIHQDINESQQQSTYIIFQYQISLA